MKLDRSLRQIAEIFIDDLLFTVSGIRPNAPAPPVKGTRREALVDRTAKAMQQAVEQELEAIRLEMESEARGEIYRDRRTRGERRQIQSCGFCVGVDLGSKPDWSVYWCAAEECGFEARDLAEALEHAKGHGWGGLAIGGLRSTPTT